MRTTVHIENLESCGCVATIVTRLSLVKNISEVEVDLDSQSVSFDFHTKHDFERAKEMLSMIGYPIIGKENKLPSNIKP